jgi:hypothetical protein
VSTGFLKIFSLRKKCFLPLPSAQMKTTRTTHAALAALAGAAIFAGALAGVVAPALLVSGCGVYNLGAGGKAPFNALALAPVKNDAHIPQAQSLLHAQLADALAQEGNVRLVNDAGDAQAVLTVRLVDYRRTVVATRSDDTALGTSYRLELVADCSLKNTREDKPYFTHRRITARALAYAPTGGAAAQNSFGAAERATVPILTRDLARQIRDAVTGVW